MGGNALGKNEVREVQLRKLNFGVQMSTRVYEYNKIDISDIIFDGQIYSVVKLEVPHIKIAENSV